MISLVLIEMYFFNSLFKESDAVIESTLKRFASYTEAMGVNLVKAILPLFDMKSRTTVQFSLADPQSYF